MDALKMTLCERAARVKRDAAMERSASKTRRESFQPKLKQRSPLAR
jgi:hypothetical protein